MSGVNETAQAPFTQYSEAVEWITGLVSFGMKPGLKRMEMFMDKLDYPHRRLKFIHVAGTNGKGSTCAYLSSVLRQCGYAVGTFTSPYITKFTNRIQLNGSDIEEEEVLRLTNRIRPICDEIAATELGSPTMFEVCTTLAILYFATSAYPDYVVWETGLGGRLDSTNIVTPVVSVITNIGHDHMEILGDSLEKVAAEKAGIIKPGVPVVCSAEQPETIQVIEQAAKDKKSTLYLMGREYHFEPTLSKENEQVFHFTGPFRTLRDITITMNGYHQFKNAALSLMTLEVLRQYYAAIIDEEDVAAAMRTTGWPGRLEMVSHHPRVLLDGAHNPEGAESLAQALRDTYRYSKLHMMVGMLAPKNHIGYLRHILPLVDTLVITEPDFRKKLASSELAGKVDELLVSGITERQIEIVIEPDWKTALRRLKQMTEPGDLAVVSGTLYLISDVRSWILYQTDSEKGW
jgi:dihydrofolate synthase/folylpolyglutamate synthase